MSWEHSKRPFLPVLHGFLINSENVNVTVLAGILTKSTQIIDSRMTA
jgi:hypothetical protein